MPLSTLVPASLSDPETGRVLGCSSPRSCCPPHPQGIMWGSCEELQPTQWQQGAVLGVLCLDRLFSLGSADLPQLLSVPHRPCTLCYLQTAPALGKGQMVHREEGAEGEAPSLGRRRSSTMAGTALRGRPRRRRGWACQADSKGHPTPIAIP